MVHYILSLEGSLSGDYGVEKNGKWSCIYAAGSQEYQVVCTRLDITSADVGSLEATMLHIMALLPTEAGYMTLKEAAKEAIGLKGLVIEFGFELKIVAGITIGSLSKAIPGPRWFTYCRFQDSKGFLRSCVGQKKGLWFSDFQKQGLHGTYGFKQKDSVWKVFQVGFDARVLWVSGFRGSKGVKDLLITCTIRNTTRSGLILEVLFCPGCSDKRV
ncbi:hypothetical protein Tco_0315980 [Tanacetum coccineum]